ncbi:MAG: hypothetical protein ACKVQC_05955, partial [Elusimicrobiota bacterium]
MINKFFSFSLALIFFLNHVVLAGIAESHVWSERKKTLPSNNQFSFGHSLGNSVSSSQKKSPDVIYIQDVHNHVEAQKNMAEKIKELIDKDKVSFLALEGMNGKVNLSGLYGYPRKNIAQAVGEFLIENNKIPGPVFAAITAPKNNPTIIGVDDPHHYQKNIDAYLGSREKIVEFKNQLNLYQKKINEEKENSSLPVKIFVDQMTRFHQGSLSLGEYVHYLSTTLGYSSKNVALFSKALDIEKKLDFSKIEYERKMFLTALIGKISQQERNFLNEISQKIKSGEIKEIEFYAFIENLRKRTHVLIPENFNDYLSYIKFVNEVEGENLFKEVHEMVNQYPLKIKASRREKRFIEDVQWYFLLAKLSDFSLTQFEWADYKVVSTQMKLRFHPAGIEPFENFYFEAENRDKSMSKNIIEALVKEKKSLSQNKSVVLVTGGFHSFGIERELRKVGLTVERWQPQFSTADKGSKYLSFFEQEKTPVEKLFQGQKLFLSGNPVKSLPLWVLTIVALWPTNKPSEQLKVLAPGSHAHSVNVTTTISKDGNPTSSITIQAGPQKAGVDVQFDKTPLKIKSIKEREASVGFFSRLIEPTFSRENLKGKKLILFITPLLMGAGPAAKYFSDPFLVTGNFIFLILLLSSIGLGIRFFGSTTKKWISYYLRRAQLKLSHVRLDWPLVKHGSKWTSLMSGEGLFARAYKSISLRENVKIKMKSGVLIWRSNDLDVLHQFSEIKETALRIQMKSVVIIQDLIDFIAIAKENKTKANYSWLKFDLENGLFWIYKDNSDLKQNFLSAFPKVIKYKNKYYLKSEDLIDFENFLQSQKKTIIDNLTLNDNGKGKVFEELKMDKIKTPFETFSNGNLYFPQWVLGFPVYFTGYDKDGNKFTDYYENFYGNIEQITRRYQMPSVKRSQTPSTIRYYELKVGDLDYYWKKGRWVRSSLTDNKGEPEDDIFRQPEQAFSLVFDRVSQLRLFLDRSLLEKNHIPFGDFVKKIDSIYQTSDINKSFRIGLPGFAGSGKSTIIKLIMSLLRLTMKKNGRERPFFIFEADDFIRPKNERVPKNTEEVNKKYDIDDFQRVIDEISLGNSMVLIPFYDTKLKGRPQIKLDTNGDLLLQIGSKNVVFQLSKKYKERMSFDLTLGRTLVNIRSIDQDRVLIVLGREGRQIEILLKKEANQWKVILGNNDKEYLNLGNLSDENSIVLKRLWLPNQNEIFIGEGILVPFVHQSNFWSVVGKVHADDLIRMVRQTRRAISEGQVTTPAEVNELIERLIQRGVAEEAVIHVKNNKFLESLGKVPYYQIDNTRASESLVTHYWAKPWKKWLGEFLNSIGVNVYLLNSDLSAMKTKYLLDQLESSTQDPDLELSLLTKEQEKKLKNLFKRSKKLFVPGDIVFKEEQAYLITKKTVGFIDTLNEINNEIERIENADRDSQKLAQLNAEAVFIIENLEKFIGELINAGFQPPSDISDFGINSKNKIRIRKFDGLLLVNNNNNNEKLNLQFLENYRRSIPARFQSTFSILEGRIKENSNDDFLLLLNDPKRKDRQKKILTVSFVSQQIDYFDELFFNLYLKALTLEFGLGNHSIEFNGELSPREAFFNLVISRLPLAEFEFLNFLISEFIEEIKESEDFDLDDLKIAELINHIKIKAQEKNISLKRDWEIKVFERIVKIAFSFPVDDKEFLNKRYSKEDLISLWGKTIDGKVLNVLQKEIIPIVDRVFVEKTIPRKENYKIYSGFVFISIGFVLWSFLRYAFEGHYGSWHVFPIIAAIFFFSWNKYSHVLSGHFGRVLVLTEEGEYVYRLTDPAQDLPLIGKLFQRVIFISAFYLSIIILFLGFSDLSIAGQLLALLMAGFLIYFWMDAEHTHWNKSLQIKPRAQWVNGQWQGGIPAGVQLESSKNFRFFPYIVSLFLLFSPSFVLAQNSVAPHSHVFSVNQIQPEVKKSFSLEKDFIYLSFGKTSSGGDFEIRKPFVGKSIADAKNRGAKDVYFYLHPHFSFSYLEFLQNNFLRERLNNFTGDKKELSLIQKFFLTWKNASLEEKKNILLSNDPETNLVLRICLKTQKETTDNNPKSIPFWVPVGSFDAAVHAEVREKGYRAIQGEQSLELMKLFLLVGIYDRLYKDSVILGNYEKVYFFYKQYLDGLFELEQVASQEAVNRIKKEKNVRPDSAVLLFSQPLTSTFYNSSFGQDYHLSTQIPLEAENLIYPY